MCKNCIDRRDLLLFIAYLAEFLSHYGDTSRHFDRQAVDYVIVLTAAHNEAVSLLQTCKVFSDRFNI